MASDDKKKEAEKQAKHAALEQALGDLNTRFPKGTIMRLGSTDHLDVDVIPTGALSLDVALGVGGLPRGRVIEIFGNEGSGKTTMCYHIMANAQKLGGECAFIDVENAMDPSYAAAVGVDIDNLLISQPESGEQALDIVEALISSGGVAVIVVDSVAALVPEAELQGDMGQQSMALQARMMSKAMRKISGKARHTDTMVVFTNQVREKVGIVFGAKTTTPGGRALPFFASVRLNISRTGSVKQGDVVVANTVKVKVAKNKVAAPFKEALFDIVFGVGVSRESCLLDMGVENEVVKKSGAFYSYGDLRLGQGRENAKIFLSENLEVADEIEEKIRAIVLPSVKPAEEIVDGGADADADADVEPDGDDEGPGEILDPSDESAADQD